MSSHRSKLLAVLATTATLSAGLAVTTAPPATAAPTDVVISEMMYHAVSDLDGDDFLELTNTGTTAVDLSGWTFSGITLTLPAGTSIAPGARLVVAKEAAQFQSTYGFAPAAVYSGNLANSGETVALRDAGGVTIDTVSFLDVDPWPVRADGTGPSLELIDSSLNNDDPLNWAAATNAAGHTAGALNSVRRSGLGPRITGVSATPTSPTPNQPVTVTATIADQTSATLRYRINFNAEQTVPMTNSGGTFSATIPGSAAGNLIRYRVEAANANTTSRSPRVDDTINFRGVVVQDNVTSAIPILRWFIADADYNAITGDPTEDIIRPAVLAYGSTVYDNVLVNIRGQGSESTPKPNWKFEMAQNYDFDMPGLLVEPVNEFAMQADYSDVAHGRSMLGFDAFQRAGVVNTQVFPVRTQRNGAFQGDLQLPGPVRRHLARPRGLRRQPVLQGQHQRVRLLGAAGRPAFREEDARRHRLRAARSPSSTASRSPAPRSGTYLLTNADLPQLINYAAVTAIIQHVDSSTKNFYLAQDPDTTRWSMLPWDLDHTFGNKCCFITSNFVTPAEPGDRINPIMEALLATPAVAGHVLPPAAHAGQRPPGDRAAWRRCTTPRSGRRSPRSPSTSRDGPMTRPRATPSSATGSSRASPAPTGGLRRGLAGAGQPAGQPEHRDRRDPALPHQR